MNELQTEGDDIISHVGQGFDVTIMYNGRAYAKIIPINNETVEFDDNRNELFGIWKDRIEIDDVNSYVRMMRQGCINRSNRMRESRNIIE